MSRLLFVFLLLFPCAGFSKPVRYEISPIFRDNALRLQVCAWFAGDADGETELLIPTRFGSANNLFRCIQNLSCATPGCRLRVDSDTLFATIEHAPGQELKLCYEVVQDFPGANVTQQTAFRPILQPSYFHVLGNTLFIAPKWGEAYEVTLEWRNFPPNWLLHNSFGSQSASQHFTFQNLRWRESVFVGGDYRVNKTEVQGQPVWLAIRGDEWSFRDDSLLLVLQRTVAVQREFWQDFEVPCYTVVLTPLAESSEQVILQFGTALTNSFTGFATPHKELVVESLYDLLHHELMHHWIGCKIRSQAGDMRFAWLIEGFTEYFALKNMLDGGFITLEQYMNRLNNHFFDNLYHSPKREAPNSAIADSFFRDPDIERLPYLRGCVFAFFLDNAMKANSNDEKNLHLLMLDMLEYYEGRDHSLMNNFDFFVETCSEYLNKDLGPLFQKHIQEGKLIPAEEFILPFYLKMEVRDGGSPFFWLDKSIAEREKGIRE